LSKSDNSINITNTNDTTGVDLKSYAWKPIEEFDRDYVLGKLISKTSKNEQRYCDHIKL